MLQNCNFSYLRSYSKQNYKLDEDAVSNWSYKGPLLPSKTVFRFSTPCLVQENIFKEIIIIIFLGVHFGKHQVPCVHLMSMLCRKVVGTTKASSVQKVCRCNTFWEEEVSRKKLTPTRMCPRGHDIRIEQNPRNPLKSSER
jgi:hypothetical protein